MKKLQVLIGITAIMLLAAGGLWDGQSGFSLLSLAEAQVYKPPLRGAPASRIGGGTRGNCTSPTDTISLSVLAPAHTGFTVEEQPTLYWYLSAPTTKHYVEVTLIDEEGVTPLLEERFDAPIQAGLHRVSLAEYGIRLMPKVEYQWSVALVCNPASRSLDVVSSGGIQRIAPPDTLRAQLAGASKTDMPRLYAQGGVWYEAISTLSALIDAAPNDTALRQLRVVLLEDAELSNVAAYDKR